jgi:dUTP pyrophosphatase
MPRRAATPRVEVRILDPRLPGWGFPSWGSELAAGLDLHACLEAPLALAARQPPALISAGFAMRIGDAGWCALVVPRSGLGHKGLVLGNLVGVIDADYEGPVLLSAWNRNPEGAIAIEPGMRIAQLVLVQIARPRFAVVPAFAGTGGRQAGGFGSTGDAAACPGAAAARNSAAGAGGQARGTVRQT